ncbi:radical SAM protein [Pseudoalteromonas xiamenensis]|uniref:radical SAM/SPASM domain-containing protein n=1 Tax=Pseudoalteromonas xiamenensis TaxID=882626 RepID=UPI0027E43AEF|nr:radical SAM protein [Pseudoalteromonas xiamenensis]WMN60564.1 radical SAM protein [Pseudoalteromonas xiamenensis]
MVQALKKDILLSSQEEEGIVYLERQLPDSSKVQIKIHPLQAFIMTLFDGTRETDEAIHVLSEVMELGLEEAKDIVNKVLDRYSLFFSELEKTSIAYTSHNPGDFIFKGDDSIILSSREDAPSAMIWVVTEDCNRKCKYCYKDAKYIENGFATDIKFPYSRVVKVIDEAALIGVNRLIFTGGEPLLRPDLPEIITHTIEQNIVPVVITKYRIEGELMERLSASGLEDIHISLDSIDPEDVLELVGVENALEDMLVSIRECVKHGIKVILRPVMTAINVEKLEKTIDTTYQMGVRHFIIDVYGQTCGRHEPKFLLTKEHEIKLMSDVEILRKRYPRAIFSFNFEQKTDKGTKGCMEGLRGITVQPDGTAVKCEHIAPGPHNTFGNLNESGLLDIWISEKTKEIVIPSRKFFKGTACYKCDLFRDCNYVRGRCTVSAKSKFGTIHAPDVYCPIGEFKRSNHIDVKIVSA